jgi:hypothetical protein
MFGIIWSLIDQSQIFDLPSMSAVAVVMLVASFIWDLIFLKEPEYKDKYTDAE